jgi:hypothetical protein
MVERVIPSIARWRYQYLAYILLLVAGLANLLITLHLPLTSHDQSGSVTVIRLMGASIALVQLGIWFVAMLGASGLMRYAKKIAHAKDGEGFLDIARSLMWLIGYIVLLPLSSSLTELSAHKSFEHALIVAHNHVPLIAMVIAAAYLYRGSRRLLLLAPTASGTFRKWRIMALCAFFGIAVVFTWDFYLTMPAVLHQRELPRFALPLPALLCTYVLPHLLTWLLGVLAILNLWQYSTRVDGNIYRHLFRNLYQGILLVFICTFIAQLLTASTVTLSQFNAGVAVIYGVLVLGIVGYLLIYQGIKQLIKLETVI